MESKNLRPYNFIDLFAGAGGMSEGFLSSGFSPVAHVEMNPEACLTLKTRACYYYLTEQGSGNIYRRYLRGKITRDELYSYVPLKVLETIINKKMAKETMQEIFESIDTLMGKHAIEKVDVIVGGPPCQAYSLVGRAVSSDNMINDPRNYLYQLYCRMLKKYQPDMFVFENVPGLLTACGGKYYKNMKKEFKRFGYDLHDKVLNASDFGVLQSRNRVILIGWKKGSAHNYPEFQKVSCDFKVNDIFRDLPFLQAGEEGRRYNAGRINKYLKTSGIRTQDDILTWHIARPHIERDREIYRHVVRAWDQSAIRLKYTNLPDELKTHKNTSAFLDRFKVVASDLPASHTVMAHLSKDGHYFIHPDVNQARSITVREAARLQSFPDNYYFEGSRTSVFTQIGNAVPPAMAKGIAEGIFCELERKCLT